MVAKEDDIEDCFDALDLGEESTGYVLDHGLLGSSRSRLEVLG